MSARITSAFLILLGLTTALPGCTSTIKRMESAEASGGTPFTQALTEEYRAFVAHEKEEDGDWSGARHFARKGLEAAEGEVVLPEEPTNVAESSAEGLTEGRSRMMTAFDGGARNDKPAVAARAQRAYDCWVHEAQEVHAANGRIDDEHVAACRDEFRAALAELEVKPVAEAQPAVVPAAPAPSTYTVLFDLNKADITGAGKAVIDEVLADAAKQTTVNISATGYADRSGSEDYNLALSLRRADAVREALINGGISAESITVSGRGEAEPAVPTPDGVPEQANRRVEIILQ